MSALPLPFFSRQYSTTTASMFSQEHKEAISPGVPPPHFFPIVADVELIIFIEFFLVQFVVGAHAGLNDVRRTHYNSCCRSAQVLRRYFLRELQPPPVPGAGAGHPPRKSAPGPHEAAQGLQRLLRRRASVSGAPPSLPPPLVFAVVTVATVATVRFGGSC